MHYIHPQLRDDLVILLKKHKITKEELNRILQKPNYHKFTQTTTRKDGTIKNREISAPEPKLKLIQRTILDRLTSLMGHTHHECVHGFVPKHNIGTNAKQHEYAKILIKIDIKDFFPSVTIHHILTLINKDMKLNRYIGMDIESFMKLILENNALPQGAPTSPLMANLVFRPIDTIMFQLAEKHQWKYSRYADDLIFSKREIDEKTTEDIQIIIGMTKSICSKYHFKINPKKIRVHRRPARMVVTGVVVNQHSNIPRRRWKNLKAAFHNINRAENKPSETLIKKLRGEFAYLSTVNEVRAYKISRKFQEIYDKWNIEINKRFREARNIVAITGNSVISTTASYTSVNYIDIDYRA
ncbi:MAG: reverse transcriptase family protein [Candidatus Saccharimonadales bacterium]